MRFRFFTVALLFPVIVSIAAISQEPASPSPDEIRKELKDEYSKWGRARVDLDNKVFDQTLAPDFYVMLPGKTNNMTRDEFIKLISADRPLVQRKRFDTNILTVQQIGDLWETIIIEKIEVEGRKDKSDSLHHYYMTSITRDGWKKVNGKWQAHYSHELAHQAWRDVVPPIENW